MKSLAILFGFLAVLCIGGTAGAQDVSEERPSTAVRLLAEVAGGFVGQLVPAGVFIALTRSDAECHGLVNREDLERDGGTCHFYGFGTYLGMLITGPANLFLAPAGVYTGGEAAGGDGNYFASLLGSALASVPAYALAPEAFEAYGPIGAMLTVTSFTLLGSIIGYELSNDGGESEPSAITPTVSFSPTGDGAFIGINGRL